MSSRERLASSRHAALVHHTGGGGRSPQVNTTSEEGACLCHSLLTPHYLLLTLPHPVAKSNGGGDGYGDVDATSSEMEQDHYVAGAREALLAMYLRREEA